MSYLVFSGSRGNYAEDADDLYGWASFRGYSLTMQECEARMPLRLGARDDWLQIVDTEVWRVVAEFRAEHPECERCQGKGHTTKWIDSVKGGLMKPIAHDFSCGQCREGKRIDQPRLWVPYAD